MTFSNARTYLRGLPLLLLLGCWSAQVEVIEASTPALNGSVNREEEVYPQQREDIPDGNSSVPLFWAPPPALAGNLIATARWLAPSNPSTAKPVGECQGYRIQIFAGTESGAAHRILTQVKSQATLDAYLIYEAPQYKVRVGNFLNRDEAALTCQQLRQQGYSESWVVKTIITPRP